MSRFVPCLCTILWRKPRTMKKRKKIDIETECTILLTTPLFVCPRVKTRESARKQFLRCRYARLTRCSQEVFTRCFNTEVANWRTFAPSPLFWSLALPPPLRRSPHYVEVSSSCTSPVLQLASYPSFWYNILILYLIFVICNCIIYNFCNTIYVLMN